MTTNQPTARQELLDELLTGEDPSAPEYPDAPAMSARVLGLRAAARIARAVQKG
ncbi:hypothetical protein ACFYST_06200 [Kitasatospora sp. NPDC004614]|uniref:hypothetical protein n=1 Tax=unclassified Kitasatospora TaxID=2633591 RepID=UPI0036A71A4E